jgi:hypothetical protein
VEWGRVRCQPWMKTEFALRGRWRRVFVCWADSVFAWSLSRLNVSYWRWNKYGTSQNEIAQDGIQLW